jgi:hypothetical protein
MQSCGVGVRIPRHPPTNFADGSTLGDQGRSIFQGPVWFGSFNIAGFQPFRLQAQCAVTHPIGEAGAYIQHPDNALKSGPMLVDYAAILACFAWHLASRDVTVRDVDRLIVLVNADDQTLSSCGYPKDAV